MNSALQMYGRALTNAAGVNRDPHAEHAMRLRFDDGSGLPLRLDRYLAAADREDLELLDQVVGPVIDLGCGPGRHLRALTARGVPSLGVDLSPAAVALARTGGAHAIVADVFDELPGAGTWRTALLLDGNIGIGGCAVRLLRRARSLLHPEGEAIVELEAAGAGGAAIRAKLEHDDRTSDWFPWVRVSVPEIGQLAAEAELRLEQLWSLDARWFARLRPATAL